MSCGNLCKNRSPYNFTKTSTQALKKLVVESGACDDFFHFKDMSHTTMQAKCQQLALRKGKYIKKHLHFALETINLLRFLPTLPLFRFLWKAFLATLRHFGEPPSPIGCTPTSGLFLQFSVVSTPLTLRLPVSGWGLRVLCLAQVVAVSLPKP